METINVGKVAVFDHVGPNKEQALSHSKKLPRFLALGKSGVKRKQLQMKCDLLMKSRTRCKPASTL